MAFTYEEIDCQALPSSKNNVDRVYTIVKCTFDNTHHKAKEFVQKAIDLAQRVNPHKANDSLNTRTPNRLLLDCFAGVLSENGWYYYIQRNFGDIVSFTEFKEGDNQIDLLLDNNKTIEVRSSFPRNGISFAICNERYNFKNICKYDNLYKESEKDKDFFACVLFQTAKEHIFKAKEVVFYLIGGSTRTMMNDQSLYKEMDLVAEGDVASIKTRYRVIPIYKALDILGFNEYLESLGYRKL